MTLLPYIRDTRDNLETMFQTFANIGACYIFPATLILFGDTDADSKTLVLRAVRKQYPELYEKHEKLFADAFQKKMDGPCKQYNLNQRIVGFAGA